MWQSRAVSFAREARPWYLTAPVAPAATYVLA